jgi:hypothetical protein
MTKKLILLSSILLTYFSILAQNVSVIEKGKIYQTDTHLFNEVRGWQHLNTSKPKSLFIGIYSNIITINEKDPIKVECEPLKTIKDNNELNTQEADAIITFLDSDVKRKCRVSFSYFKNSGLRVLHIFFIKEKWLSYYFSFDSNINDIKNDDWELGSLTLPNQRFKIKDFDVTILKINNTKINDDNITPYRAVIDFSENGGSILVYDKNGKLIKGFGLIGENKMMSYNSNELQKNYSTGAIGSNNDYSKVDISLTRKFPTGYSILMIYAHYVNNKEVDALLVSKESNNLDYTFRLF